MLPVLPAAYPPIICDYIQPVCCGYLVNQTAKQVFRRVLLDGGAACRWNQPPFGIHFITIFTLLFRWLQVGAIAATTPATIARTCRGCERRRKVNLNMIWSTACDAHNSESSLASRAISWNIPLMVSFSPWCHRSFVKLYLHPPKLWMSTIWPFNAFSPRNRGIYRISSADTELCPCHSGAFVKCDWLICNACRDNQNCRRNAASSTNTQTKNIDRTVELLPICSQSRCSLPHWTARWLPPLLC